MFITILIHNYFVALKCPGPTSCAYFGGMDICNQPVIPVSSLPTTCTGYFYDGFLIDEKFVVQNEYDDNSKGNKKMSV